MRARGSMLVVVTVGPRGTSGNVSPDRPAVRATVRGAARRLELRHHDHGHLQTLLTIASPYPAGGNHRIAIGLLRCNGERDAFPEDFACPQLEV